MTVSDNLASFGVAYFQSFIFFSASSSVFLFEFRACVYFIICREGKRKIDIHHSFLVFLFCSTNVFPFQFSFPAQPWGNFCPFFGSFFDHFRTDFSAIFCGVDHFYFTFFFVAVVVVLFDLINKIKKNVLVWFILIGLISIASGSFFPGHLGINLSRWLCIQFHLIINFCFRYEYSAVCLHLS